MDDVALGGGVSAEVVAMFLLENFDILFVASHECSKSVEIGVGVGGIGEHLGGIREVAEKTVEGVDGGFAIREGSKGLGDFAHFGIHHQLLAFPVAGKPFEEVVALYVTVVVGAWNIGWIHVNEIATLLHVEDIAATGRVALAVTKHSGIVSFNLFDEVLADSELKVSSSILIPGGVANGEKTSWLPLNR